MIDLSKINQGWGFNAQTNDWGKKAKTNPVTTALAPLTPKAPGGTTAPTYDFGGQYDSSGNPTDEWNSNYGRGAYNWYDQRVAPNLDPSNPNYDPLYPNIKQNWWFSPEWAQPGGQDWLYNPTAGFQNLNSFRNFYEQGPADWNQFSNYDWASTAGDFPGWWQGGGEDGGGENVTNPGLPGPAPWDEYFANGGVQDTTQYPADPWNPGSLVTPSQWDTASDVATNYAYGYPTQNPWEWDAAAQATTNQPWYDAMKGVVQTDTNDAIKQAAEQAGLGGMRWSTPLGRTAQDISGRNMAQLGTTWAGMEQQAKEAAQGRLMQTGSNKAGLQETARDRALQATGLLSQLGGQTTDYATGLTDRLMSGGGTMSGQANQQAQNIYNQFLRSTPEGNPWLQAALGLGSTPGTPQTYNPSGGSQLLSGLGSLAPLLALK